MMKRSHVRAGPGSQGPLTCRRGSAPATSQIPTGQQLPLTTRGLCLPFQESPPSTLLSLLCFPGLKVAFLVDLGVSLDETLLSSCLLVLGVPWPPFSRSRSALWPQHILLLFSKSVCKSLQARGRGLGEGLFSSFSGDSLPRDPSGCYPCFCFSFM